jgi:Serine dehydrogenase proteinase
MSSWPAPLEAWQARRGRPAIVFLSPIDDASVPVLYRCLEALGRVEQLDLVLATKGGAVTIARRIAMLLREFTARLTIVVPHEARSAGTLLCLGADDLVLGPLAELSPIDANLNSTWPPANGADQLSAEDIRAFRAMAEDWFGVTGEEDRLQVLALVAQRVFPGSLAALYRYDRSCRRTADELLRIQLPDAADADRQRIVDQLVAGFDAHDHVITRADAVALGLAVSAASPELEALAWEVLAAHRHELLERPAQPGESGVTGMITSAPFSARRMQRWEPGQEGPGSSPQAGPRISWEVDQ